METDLELLRSIDRKLSALIALAVEQQAAAGKDYERKPEVILDLIGVPMDQIAAILGKNEPAVRKAIQRARTPSRQPSKEAVDK